MSNDNFKQFIDTAKRVSITNKERSDIKEQILLFVNKNPITPRNDGFLAIANFNSFMSARFVPATLILVLILAGGVSMAAEGALPNELLYGVKVNVNEEVRSVLSFSVQSKARWESERAIRRLEEAEKLESRHDLSQETALKIEANFQKHSSKVLDKIEKLETKESLKSAAEISSGHESSLRAHSKILEKLSAKNGVSTKKIKNKVESEKNTVTNKRGKLDKKITEEDKEGNGEAFVASQKASRQTKERSLLLRARGELNIDIGVDDKESSDQD